MILELHVGALVWSSELRAKLPQYNPHLAGHMRFVSIHFAVGMKIFSIRVRLT